MARTGFDRQSRVVRPRAGKPQRPEGGDRVAQPASARVLDSSEATLLDLVDRLLSKGVMAFGDLTLGVAGVDLIYVRLSAVLCAADRVLQPSRGARKRRHPRRPATVHGVD